MSREWHMKRMSHQAKEALVMAYQKERKDVL